MKKVSHCEMRSRFTIKHNRQIVGGARQRALAVWMKTRKTAAYGSEGLKLSSQGAADAEFLLSAFSSGRSDWTKTCGLMS